MKPNDSQVHSHFGRYTHVKVTMFRALVKKTNKHQLGPHDTIKNFLKCKCLKFPCIVHLDMICMSYDIKKKGQSQIGNLTLHHISLERRGQMKSNWSVLHTIGKIFSRAIRYSLKIPKKT
jgi:hypothetical protein